MPTVLIVLAFCALATTLVGAAGKIPLWVPVFILAVFSMLLALPK